MKTGKLNNLTLPFLEHPFEIRDNPFDYATFEEVLLRRTYDISFTAKPTSIIDGGANIGLTSIFFASRFPNARIVSIEPEEGNFELLKKNAAPYKNITPLKGGVWSHHTWLEISDASAGNNAFTVTEQQTPTKDSIEAFGISELMQQHDWERIDVVKLDVEGSEKEIFSGGYEYWLPKTKVLIVEMHDQIKPGCSQAVMSATKNYDFSMRQEGENHIFINHSL